MLTVTIQIQSYDITCISYNQILDMSSQHIKSSLCKRKQFQDITNTYNNSKRSNIHTLLSLSDDVKMNVTEHQQYTDSEQNKLINLEKQYQIVHPLLGWYKHDLDTGLFSYDKFQQLTSTEKEGELLDFLIELNLMAKERRCLLCGGMMRRKKD